MTASSFLTILLCAGPFRELVCSFVFATEMPSSKCDTSSFLSIIFNGIQTGRKGALGSQSRMIPPPDLTTAAILYQNPGNLPHTLPVGGHLLHGPHALTRSFTALYPRTRPRSERGELYLRLYETLVMLNTP